MIRKEEVLIGTIEELNEEIHKLHPGIRCEKIGALDTVKEQLNKIKFIDALDDSLSWGIIFAMEEKEVINNDHNIPEINFELIKINVRIENNNTPHEIL